MGDQKSSARPHQLLAYYIETQKINDALERHHSPLVEALQRFQSTCTEFPVPCDLRGLPDGLSQLAGYVNEHDTWVRTVGLEFLAADETATKAKFDSDAMDDWFDANDVFKALLLGYSRISRSNFFQAIIDGILTAIEMLKEAAEVAPTEREQQYAEISNAIANNDFDEAIRLTIEYYQIDASIAMSITYDSSVSGEGETSEDGYVYIGDAAFASPGWLATTIQHELVHVQQIEDTWYLGEQGVAINEIEAYDLEIRNAEQNNLTEEQIEELHERRKDWYDMLSDENKERVDDGNYTLPDDKKDT